MQVEFRAPSSIVAERLVAQHEEVVTGLTQAYSAASCTGRRSLLEAPDAPTIESAEVADLRKQLKLSNEKLKQSNKQLTQKDEQLKQSSVTVAELTQKVADCEAGRRGENKTGEASAEAPPQPERRQVQVLTETPEFSRVVLPSGEIRACAVLPCELAGACLNGGECIPGIGGDNDFTCRCSVGFAGVQCGDAVAVSGGDPCGAGTIVDVPADGSGSMQIVFEPAGGYAADADCSWVIECPAAMIATLQFISFDTEVKVWALPNSLLLKFPGCVQPTASASGPLRHR